MPAAATRIARPSALMIILAVVLASCGPIPSPAPSGSASAQAGQSGATASAGSIEFGLTVVLPDANDLLATPSVPAPVTTARLSDKVGWIAHLSSPAGDTSLTLALSRTDPSGPEETVYRETMPSIDPQTVLVARPTTESVTSLAATPGSYALRIIRPSDGTVLAQGTINLTG